MKKIITLLLFTLTAFSYLSFAQPGTVCNPEFDFTVTGNTVQFRPAIINTSAVLQHHWLFGDGSTGTNLAAPLHVYPGPGIYTVKHFVKYRSPNDSSIIVCADSATRQVAIVGLPACTIQANFSFVRDSSQPNKVYFSNLSAGTTPNTAVKWNFGDGTFSYDDNPTHIYSTSGAYRVCLLLRRDSLCADDTCKIVQVQLPTNTCNLVAGFGSRPDSLDPLTIHFTNHSLPFDPTDSIRYTFGDGHSSNGINPSHTYTAAGTYHVCIRVKKITQTGTAPCVREFCKTVIVQQPVSCNLHSNFSFVRDSVQTNKVYFNNLSTGTTSNTMVKWYFGDGTFSYDNNPAHIYTTSGTYTVCLLLRRDSLCADDTCKIVQVQLPTNTCNLVAGFDSHPDSLNPLTIHFTNHSLPFDPADSIRYTFGDGNSATNINPTHTYGAAGTYSVCVRVKKVTAPGTAPCVREFCRIIVVPVPVCNLVANFISRPDSINPRVVHFTNLSTALASTDSVRWTFGDGASSSDINPEHTFTSAGSFTVCLRVKKITQAGSLPCVSEYCKTILIQQPIPCTLVANFSFYSDTLFGGASGAYRFANTSYPLTAMDSSFWDFGDGTPLVINPNDPLVHTYAAPGIYIVCLKVKKVLTNSSNVVCERQVCKTIIVPAPCNLLVDFNTRTDSVNPRKIIFTNLANTQPSQAIATWTFGDGTGGNSWNADHTFAQPGQYTVCLKVSLNNTCRKDTCKIITVLASPQDSCNIQVGFVSRIDSPNRRKVYFINTSVPLTTAAIVTWSFGDGTVGTSWNADHVYAQPGRYAVCLTVTRGNNCTRTWCDSVFVPGSTVPPVNCDSIHIGYVYRRDAYMPNKLFFFATANRPVVQQYWTFTRLPNGGPVSVNQHDPVHVFGDTGRYRVCLKGIFWGGCVKEYCDTISIYSVATPQQCVLVAYPNPAHNQVSVNLHLQQPELITAAVYNAQNVLLIQRTQQGFTGNNLVTLNIENLVPGYYTIRLVYGNKVCYARFQKL